MTEPKKAEVTLATKHVHGGREYDRGDVLTLREDQAAWLIAKQIAVKKGDALPALPSGSVTIGSQCLATMRSSSTQSVISESSSGSKSPRDRFTIW